MLQMIKSNKMYLLYSGLVLAESIVIGIIFNSNIITIFFAVVMLLYMDIVGEVHGRFSMRCRLLERNYNAQSYKVMQAFNRVKKKAEIQYPSIKKVNLYFIQTEDINAYSFGRRSVGITAGAMELDSRMIEAILSHELGHTINGDMFFYRFLFGNLMGAMVLVGIWNAAIIGVVILFGIIIFGFSALRLNFVTYQISSFLINILKKLLSGIQSLMLGIGEAIISIVSRRSEYNADMFAYRMGYGNYLCMFLSKYAMNIEAFRPRTILEVIYASHPEPIDRINHLKRIEQ